MGVNLRAAHKKTDSHATHKNTDSCVAHNVLLACFLLLCNTQSMDCIQGTKYSLRAILRISKSLHHVHKAQSE